MRSGCRLSAHRGHSAATILGTDSGRSHWPSMGAFPHAHSGIGCAGPYCPISNRVMSPRNILAPLVMLFAAIVLSAPAAARGGHEVAHAATPVADGEHHHHDDDGSIDSHADHDAAPASQDGGPTDKTGHSHIGSSAFDLNGQPASGLALAVAFPEASLSSADTPALGTLGWVPPIRPPRTA